MAAASAGDHINLARMAGPVPAPQLTGQSNHPISPGMEFDLDNMRALVRDGIPHMAAVGLELISMDASGVVGRIPHRAEFVGDPSRGVVHGGIVTVLLDSISGMSIVPVLGGMSTTATLDLRVDYLKPAAPGKDLFAKVRCYKTTRHIAFTRGIAYQDDPDDPIAHATGSFMLSPRGESGQTR